MAQLYPKADPEGVQGVQSNPLSTPNPPRFKISYQNRITWHRRDQIISFSWDILGQMRSNQQCDHTQIHTRMHARTQIPHPSPHRTRSHVAYQIYVNGQQNTMLVYIMSLHTPSTSRMGVKRSK